MNQLPAEVIVKIYSYTQPGDLLNSYITTKTTRSAVISCEQDLWENVYRTHAWQTPDPAFAGPLSFKGLFAQHMQQDKAAYRGKKKSIYALEGRLARAVALRQGGRSAIYYGSRANHHGLQQLRDNLLLLEADSARFKQAFTTVRQKVKRWLKQLARPFKAWCGHISRSSGVALSA